MTKHPIEIQPTESFKVARVYCKYCVNDHFFDVIQSDYKDFTFKFQRESYPPISFLRRLQEARTRLNFSNLKNTVEIVALDKEQISNLINVLDQDSRFVFSPQVDWKEKETGVIRWLTGHAKDVDEDLVLSVELISHEDHEEEFIFESVNIGWRLYKEYTRWNLVKDFLSYLLYSKRTILEEYCVYLEDPGIESVVSFLRYVQSKLSIGYNNEVVFVSPDILSEFKDT